MRCRDQAEDILPTGGSPRVGGRSGLDFMPAWTGLAGYFRRDLDLAVLRAAMTRNGGEQMLAGWDDPPGTTQTISKKTFQQVSLSKIDL